MNTRILQQHNLLTRSSKQDCYVILYMDTVRDNSSCAVLDTLAWKMTSCAWMHLELESPR